MPGVGVGWFPPLRPSVMSCGWKRGLCVPKTSPVRCPRSPPAPRSPFIGLPHSSGPRAPTPSGPGPACGHAATVLRPILRMERPTQVVRSLGIGLFCLLGLFRGRQSLPSLTVSAGGGRPPRDAHCPAGRLRRPVARAWEGGGCFCGFQGSGSPSSTSLVTTATPFGRG